jgi:iron complex transport system substrate-binding protein
MPQFARAVALGVAGALSALAVTAQGDVLCRDAVKDCAADGDHFPDRVSFERANATIKGVTYGAAFVDVDVFSASLEEDFKYRFVRCGCEAVAGAADGRVRVSVPVGGLYVGDTVIMSMLTDQVDGRDFVRAVGDVTFAYSARVRREVAQGKYRSVAALSELDALAGQIDASVINDFSVADYRNRTLYGGSIPFVVSAESGERDPLGRAEWVKLFGILVGKEKQTTALYEAIKFRYETVKNQAFAVRRRPSVLVNTPTQMDESLPATWTQPGGNQYTAAFLRDANTDYRFADDGSAAGNDLTVDAVVANFSSARYWVNFGRFPAVKADTLDALLGDGKEKKDWVAAYRKLAAVKCGNVWSLSKEVTDKGEANNFFEEGALRPDLILQDMLTIFHPGVTTADPADLKFYYSLGKPSKGVADACPFNELPEEAAAGKKFHVTELEISGVDRFGVEDRLAAGGIAPAVAKAANVSAAELEIFFDRPDGPGNKDAFAKVRAMVDGGAKVDPKRVASAFEKELGKGAKVSVVSSETGVTSRKGGDNGLGGGAIAGIVLGSLALAAALVTASWCFAARRAKRRAANELKDRFWAEHGVRLAEDARDGPASNNSSDVAV